MDLTKYLGVNVNKDTYIKAFKVLDTREDLDNFIEELYKDPKGSDLKTFETLLKNIACNIWSLKRILAYICKQGYVDLISSFFMIIDINDKLIFTTTDKLVLIAYGLEGACMSGQVEIGSEFLQMLKKDLTELNRTYVVSSQINDAYHAAASGNNLELVKMLSQISHDHSYALKCAVKNSCNLDIIDYIISNYSNVIALDNIHWIFYSACNTSNYDLMKLVLDHEYRYEQGYNYNIAMCIAAYRGNIFLVKYMLSLGASEINNGLISVSLGTNGYNYVEGVHLRDLAGGRDIDENNSSMNNTVEIAKIFLDLGAVNYDKAISECNSEMDLSFYLNIDSSSMNTANGGSSSSMNIQDQSWNQTRDQNLIKDTYLDINSAIKTARESNYNHLHEILHKNDYNLTKLLIDHISNNIKTLSHIMKYICEKNQLNSIDYLVSTLESGEIKESVLSNGLQGACISDNYDLAERMISLGANGNYIYYTEQSCYHNLNILRLVIERCGISNPSYAINILMMSNKYNCKIIEYLLGIENPTTQILKNVLYRGVSDNNTELVELAIKYGANDFNDAARKAGLEGYYDLLVKLISYGADNFDEIFVAACLCYKCTEKDSRKHDHDHDQNIKIAKLLIRSYNIDDFDKAIKETGCKYLIKFLVDNGASPKSACRKYSTSTTDSYIEYIFYLNECINKLSMVLNDDLIQGIRSFV